MTAARRTYLDYNASAPLRPEARVAMIDALAAAGNPSSVHAEGRRARAIVDRAREQVAALVNAKPDEVVFTSGGTEANNWVLSADWDAIVAPPVEHDSVLAIATRATDAVRRLPINREGVVDARRVSETRERAGGHGVLSVQMANNETGVLQDVRGCAEAARANGLAAHTDAVQAAGKLAVDFQALGVDFLSLSAHKLGGPKGVGALVASGDSRLAPWFVGGGQERRRRAGTENVAGVAGFGAAADAALRDLKDTDRIQHLRDRLEREVKRITPDVLIIGEAVPRLPNTSCIALPGRKAETLVIVLDLAGVAVSAGAACSSGKVTRSHVLAAMGFGDEIAASAVRVSLGWATTADDIEAFLRAWSSVAAKSAVAPSVLKQPVLQS